MHCRQILAHMNPCGPSVQKEVQPRMAKISANYEVVFIMDGRLPEEQVAALTEKFKTLVEQNSTAMEVEEWGKRKLAYAISSDLLHERARFPQGIGPYPRHYRWYHPLHDRLQGRIRRAALC